MLSSPEIQNDPVQTIGSAGSILIQGGTEGGLKGTACWCHCEIPFMEEELWGIQKEVDSTIVV